MAGGSRRFAEALQTRTSRVAIWMCVALLAAVSTSLALPPAITNPENGPSDPNELYVSLSGVTDVDSRYVVETEPAPLGDGKGDGILNLGFTAAPGQTPSAVVSWRLDCGLSFHQEGALSVDEDGTGSLDCRVAPPSQGSLTSTTVISPSVSAVAGYGFKLRRMSARVSVGYPPSAIVQGQPEDHATRLPGAIIWESTSSCHDGQKVSYLSRGVLTCTANSGWLSTTVTVISDQAAQSVSSWRMFLAGILASATISATIAASQEVTRAPDHPARDRTPSEPRPPAPRPRPPRRGQSISRKARRERRLRQIR